MDVQKNLETITCNIWAGGVWVESALGTIAVPVSVNMVNRTLHTRKISQAAQ